MEPECTVFVACLEKRVTEEILLELFIQAGPVRSVKIPKDRSTGENRTFAFVTFDNEVSVPYASELFNGLRLFQKSITCKPQQTGSDSKANSPSASPVSNRTPHSYSPRRDNSYTCSSPRHDDYQSSSPSSHYSSYDDRYSDNSNHTPQSGFHTPPAHIMRHNSSPLHRQAVMSNPRHHQQHSYDNYTPSPPHYQQHHDRGHLHRRNSSPGHNDHDTHHRHHHSRHHPYNR